MSINVSGKIRLHVKPHHIKEGAICEASNCAIAQVAATRFRTGRVSVSPSKILVDTPLATLRLTPLGRDQVKFGYLAGSSHGSFVLAYDLGGINRNTRTSFTYAVETLIGYAKLSAQLEIDKSIRSYKNDLAAHLVVTGEGKLAGFNY